MPRRSIFFAAIALALSQPVRAEDVAPPHPLASDPGLGGRYTPDAAVQSAQLRVGCLDHRSLMRITSEIEGDDPALARLLAERDCRPLVPDAVYLRCGPGGYAYPAKGERLTYSLYCRTNVADAQLYVLDELMADAPAKP